MAPQETYILNRSTWSSVRLTSQHFLWDRQLGWNLHPTIATFLRTSNEDVAVADFACGNGIWIIEESRNHPQSTQFYGFDISGEQFPLKETWAPNVHFDQLDAYKTVPEKYRGRFDAVHCRLILGAVKCGDPWPFLRMFLDLLKPGGFLQWGEVNVHKQLVFPKEMSQPKWESFFVDLINKSRPGAMKFDWLGERPKLLRGHGMEDVAELSGGDPRMELRHYWTDNEFAVLSEAAAGTGAGDEASEDLAQGRKQGFDSHFEIKVENYRFVEQWSFLRLRSHSTEPSNRRPCEDPKFERLAALKPKKHLKLIDDRIYGGGRGPFALSAEFRLADWQQRRRQLVQLDWTSMLRGRCTGKVLIDRFRSFSTCCSTFQEFRPPTAFKQHPDIAHLRDHVELYEGNALLRNYQQHEKTPSQIASNAQRISEINITLKKPRVQIKALQSQLTSKTADKQKVLAEIKRLKPLVNKLVKEQDDLEEASRTLALALPNLTSPKTPTNGNEKVISYINYDPSTPPSFAKSADHSLIGEKLQLIDFASASMVSGWGFYYLLNEAALLEHALVQYALSVARRHGWQTVTPPSLVYSHIADACGFQPRDQNDEQQIWQVAQPAKDQGKPKRSLAATAEIPLAGLYAGREIKEQDLPLKLVGCSRCYRAEAGARGVDTKGLYRVHEFTKVEMFAWTDGPGCLNADIDVEEWVAKSTEVFDEMVAIQAEILSSLGLPCRILEMPSSDLGASAYRKIDIEALFPSRLSRDGGWGEVTSVSICTDYQSRRLDTRIIDRAGSRKKFPHTVNGTAVAIPRVLAAVLEHGWRSDEECVVVPECLRPYMSGLARIQKKPA